jgi:energy-coupling factor transport system substrate-specific component
MVVKMNVNVKKILCVILSALLVLAVLPAAAPNDAEAVTPLRDCGRAFLSQYVQTLFGEDSAIPAIDVNAILQTSDGYLWLATYQGLMRYNGMNSRVFTAEDGFPSDKINALFEDSAGRLWIGTNDSGFVMYSDEQFTVFGLDRGAPSSSVRGFSEGSDGAVLVATVDGIAVICEEGEVAVHPVLNTGFVTQVEYVGYGRFISLFNDGRIVKHDRYSIIKDLLPGHFGNASPSSIFLASTGVFYIGTDEATIYLSDATLASHTAITNRGLLGHNAFYEDSRRRIWVIAENGAAYFYRGNLTVLDGLLMNYRLRAFYEDFEGNFWLGSARSGVLQLSRGKFTNITFLAELPNYVVNTTAVWNGELYIGTDSGLFVLNDYNAVASELAEMLADIRIRSLFVDSRNRLWICTFRDFGIVMVDSGGEIVSVTEDEGLISNRVRCVVEAPNGDIYVGTSGGISVIRAGEVVRNFSRANGLSNDVILSLTVGDGVMIAGTDGGGIYFIDGESVVANFTERDGLSSGVIQRTAFDGNGLWIAATDALNYMDVRGNISVFGKLELRGDSVYDIKIFGDEIWFLRQRGISIGSVENLLSDDEPIFRHLQRRDGFSSTVTANSRSGVSGDGTLYIAMASQVLSINTREIPSSTIVPRAAISEVYADGSRIFAGADGSLTIPSGVNRLDIHIALLSFASREGSISYKLDGFDDDFTTVARSDISLISYTNLPGGTYTFHLFGTNADGISSTAVTLTINKEFSFFEQPFVLLLAALLVAGLVFMIARTVVIHRTRTLERQKSEYKETAGRIMAVASQMSDLKNEWSRGHSRRVADYSVKVGQRLGMDESELETLYYAALLHDIGDVCIPDAIHNKRSALTDAEHEIVKNHVRIGGDLLRGISVMGDISVGARYHHERVDGTGYAEGLKGDEIPLVARIITVCNSFDCMQYDRPHKKAIHPEKVQSEFIANAGTQFDERVTAVLISLMNEGEIPCDKAEESDETIKVREGSFNAH